MARKHLFAGIGLVVAVLAVGGGLAAWKIRAQRADANKPASIPPEFVDVIPVETVSWGPTARLVGTVVAKRSVMLANEVAGKVTEVKFAAGDAVEAGQVLMTLDTATELADLAGAEAAERLGSASIDVADANVKSAESNLALARNMQRRLADASVKNSVSAMDIDKSNADVDKYSAELARERSSLEHARAELDQARARVAQIKTVIAKKTLTAPFRARAGMLTTHAGQYLAEGASIVALQELTDDIYLDFAIPQEYAARVAPGFTVMAASRVLGDKAVPVTVVSMDATVNPTTRNVRVRATVPNRGQTLRPGMFIDVEVPTEAERPCLVIPATAVRRAAYGDHVYVLTPGDPQADGAGSLRAKQRMVTLGPDLGGKVIVTSGLTAADLIAGSGSFKLREGALVMKAQPAGGQANATDGKK